MPQLPLTAVGKIHKPTLRRNEAREALEAGLREANLPVRAVEIVDDPSRGMLARLQIDDEASRERAQQVLGRFPIRFTIE